MNSVVQSLLKIPEIAGYYMNQREAFFSANVDPATNFRVQMCAFYSSPANLSGPN